MNTDKLYWKIEAETSLSQVLLLIILGVIINKNSAWILFSIPIIGNIYTMFKATSKLAKNKNY